MDATQKITPVEKSTPSPLSSVKPESYNAALETLIDYRALNGLITNDDGMKKMTFEELASALGLTRNTLYSWQEKTPDFWDRVNARRREIAPRSRLAAVHETWFLKARSGSFQHMQLWLANHDPEFRMPTEKVEHEVGGGLADLLQSMRKRKVIEAESTADAPNNNTNNAN